MDKMEARKTLIEKIDQAIEDAGTNYKAASLKAGLGETAIRDIVKNRAGSPKVETLQAIAAALNRPVSYFVSEENEFTQPEDVINKYVQGFEEDESLMAAKEVFLVNLKRVKKDKE